MGPNPTALNRVPAATQVVNGVSQLMQGFVNTKRAEEQHYGSKVDDVATQLANGLITPEQVDFKQVAQWMKKSGRPYNTDLTPAQSSALQAQQQQTQFQQTLGQAQGNVQQLASQSSGMPAQGPGPMGSPGQPGMPAPGMVPPSTPVAAAPGFMDRLRQMVGMTPQNPNVARPDALSPAAQQLQTIGQAAQGAGGAPGAISRGLQDSVLAHNVQQAAGKLGIAHSEAMAPVYSGIFKQALNGDLNSMTMLRRLDVMKGVPVDEVGSLYKAENPQASDSQANAQAAKLLLWQQGGGPQLQLRIADLAKDMIPRFGGDAGKAMGYVNGLYSGQPTGDQPGMTTEEFSNFADGANKIMERYPAAPAGLADMYSQAKVSGKDKLAANVLDFLSSHYQTKGQVAHSEFQMGITKDYSQIAAQNQVANREADASNLRAYAGAMDTLEKPAKEILEDPKMTEHFTADQIEGAYKSLTDKQNELAGKLGTPLDTILDRNNITDTHLFYGHGPKLQHQVLPSPAPAQTAPMSTDQWQQLLMNGAGSNPQMAAPGLQQMLMNRAQGR